MRKPSVVPNSIELVKNFPWHEVQDPPAGSGAMTDPDGRELTPTEVDEWLRSRLEARRHRP